MGRGYYQHPMDEFTDTRNLAQDSPHNLELSGRVVETQVDELMIGEGKAWVDFVGKGQDSFEGH